MTRLLSIPALVAMIVLSIVAFAPTTQARMMEDPKTNTVEASHSHDDGHGHTDGAHGDDHGHEKLGALPTVYQGVITGVAAILVFAVVFAVLATKVWPAIAKGLDERSRKIKDEIESAEMARKQAKDALEQYENSLKEARAEAQKMLEKARAQQQALHDEMKAKNEAEIVQMREKARRDIDAAKREALAELYSTAGDLATSAAGKILRREVSGGDTRRLMDETMAELSGSR